MVGKMLAIIWRAMASPRPVLHIIIQLSAEEAMMEQEVANDGQLKAS
jgi:hypothetical protein